MIYLITIVVVLIFVLVITHLLLEQKGNRMDFYEQLQKEDKEEINQILDEEENSKFKIVDKAE
mgnify:FL=1